MQPNRPVWSSDVPVSMPEPVSEDTIVPMYGFAMTGLRLVHDLTEAEFSELRVPIFEPRDPSQPEEKGDRGIDG